VVNFSRAEVVNFSRAPKDMPFDGELYLHLKAADVREDLIAQAMGVSLAFL
jgi:hypothetical protein